MNVASERIFITKAFHSITPHQRSPNYVAGDEWSESTIFYELAIFKREKKMKSVWVEKRSFEHFVNSWENS